MLTNINTETGIRYGYISADSLDPDLVHTLMHEEGKDLAYEEYMEALEKKYGDDFDECRASDDYYCDEPVIHGEHEGVKYISSWLGGALHFFITESPVVARCVLCSPCVPNAGDLDTPGDVMTYSVHNDWRREENEI